MVLPDRGKGSGLNEHGEVNWTRSEMVILTDEEALALMEAHRCTTTA